MNEQAIDPTKKESPMGLAMEDIQKSLSSLTETIDELTSRTTQIRNAKPSTMKDTESAADTPSQPTSALTSKLRACNKTTNTQTARLAKILLELDI